MHVRSACRAYAQPIVAVQSLRVCRMSILEQESASLDYLRTQRHDASR